jgi:F-type H+-transporting ATPase subunit gamma
MGDRARFQAGDPGVAARPPARLRTGDRPPNLARTMAKARAIVKRRKAVRNIKKITKTMQMIATAKFQKALKRAVGTKPYTRKVRELVGELAATLGEDVSHPLLRPSAGTGKVALLVITSDRGLAGAYNGSVLRMANGFIKSEESAGRQVELSVSGKKGVGYFNFQRRPIVAKLDKFSDMPKYADVEAVAEDYIRQFVDGKVDSVRVAYTQFISAGQQKAEVMQLLPLASLGDASAPPAKPGDKPKAETVYEFSPDAKTLLDELLPLTVKAALFQAFLDATTSENVARMVAMKSATDNADKMAKALTMQYNRARQSQITTELSEIMGGVEAMSAA